MTISVRGLGSIANLETDTNPFRKLGLMKKYTGNDCWVYGLNKNLKSPSNLASYRYEPTELIDS
jgi:hypothetical protein